MAEMKFKGTPGPWFTEIAGDGKYVTTYYDEGLHRNFSVVGFGVDEALANARLISAAPNLLEALALFLNRMDRFGNWDDGCFYYEGRAASELQEPIILARAAIAKALQS